LKKFSKSFQKVDHDEYFFSYFQQMATPQRLTDTFCERLSLFTFFHLGSDARIGIAESQEGLIVTVAHSRVVPFEFRLSWPEIEQMLADPARFEGYMLDHLTRHRQS